MSARDLIVHAATCFRRGEVPLGQVALEAIPMELALLDAAQPLLAELHQAQYVGDYLCAADLIDYELVPLLPR